MQHLGSTSRGEKTFLSPPPIAVLFAWLVALGCTCELLCGEASIPCAERVCAVRYGKDRDSDLADACFPALTAPAAGPLIDAALFLSVRGLCAISITRRAPARLPAESRWGVNAEKKRRLSVRWLGVDVSFSRLVCIGRKLSPTLAQASSSARVHTHPGSEFGPTGCSPLEHAFV